MAKTETTGAAKAAAKTEAVTTEPKMRRLNKTTEEYVVGFEGQKNEELEAFDNLYPARNSAVKRAIGAKKDVKIWIRDLASQKKVEEVGSYEPKAEKVKVEKAPKLPKEPKAPKAKKGDVTQPASATPEVDGDTHVEPIGFDVESGDTGGA